MVTEPAGAVDDDYNWEDQSLDMVVAGHCCIRKLLDVRRYAIPGPRSQSHTRSGGRPGPRQSTSGSAATLPCPSAGAGCDRSPEQSRSASACSKDILQPCCSTATPHKM